MQRTNTILSIITSVTQVSSSARLTNTIFRFNTLSMKASTFPNSCMWAVHNQACIFNVHLENFVCFTFPFYVSFTVVACASRPARITGASIRAGAGSMDTFILTKCCRIHNVHKANKQSTVHECVYAYIQVQCKQSRLNAACLHHFNSGFFNFGN